MVYTFVYRGFRICSNWIKFHTELTFLKKKFRKNGYPYKVFDKLFKKLLGNIHLVKDKVPTAERNRFC